MYYNMSNCSHIIIRDWIDITPERGMYIHYCTFCYASYCLEQLQRIDDDADADDTTYTVKPENRQSDLEHPSH